MSNANAPELIGLESPKARGLLAALANLVKPMVYECMASDTPRMQPAADEIDSASSGQSPEHEFVKCLKCFIAETIEECRVTESPPSTSSPNSTDASLSTALVRVNLNIIDDTSRPGVIPAEFRQVFKDYVLKKIRRYVSYMPTRLLAFDKNGSQICLINHREAVMYLFERICADIADCTPHFVDNLMDHFRDDSTGHFVTREDYPAKYQIDVFVGKYTRYTILSHTWTKASSGEISYQDWPTREQNHAGYEKIKNFCEASARDHGYRLGWIDTCCINKESSAELDEAIRSMYKWYQNADLCIVYLSETNSQDDMPQDSWFTRGWTLQELVAPRRMAVYNKNWTILTCNQESVAAAAGIQASEIRNFRHGDLDSTPISRRLQMACGRQVTREEDSAYSLMGILGVSIPIAYGEGSERAFSRLIREVISTKRYIMDIFNRSYSIGYTNIIPITVDAYKNRSDAFIFETGRSDEPLSCRLKYSTPSEPFLLTHMGLHIHLLLVPGLYYDVLNTPFRPIGDFYGEFCDFILLEQSIFSEPHDQSSVTVFGVVNFSITNGNICIQNPSISVPLSFTGSYSMQTESHQMWPRILPSRPIFTLKSSKDPEGKCSEITIPENKLKSHGLRLVMIYL